MSGFQFKQFSVQQDNTALKLGTDAVLLGAWTHVDEVDAILDVGTGSGILALMLAQRNPTAKIVGIEPDKGSAADAELNFKASAWSDRLRLFPLTLQEFLRQQPNDSFDLLISNPPFFEVNQQIENPSREKARQQASLNWETLFSGAAQLLKPTGKISLVIPVSAEEAVVQQAENQGFYISRRCEVSSRSDKKAHRILMEWGRSEKEIQRSHLIIMGSKEANDYSREYQALTRDFYLDIASN